MLRDMATASLLGMSGSGVMDAFVVAFRIPNLFRRLFGEGALAASYVPVLSERLEHDRAAAWQLTSVVLAGLAVLLAILTLLAEGICWLAWLHWGARPESRLLIGLTAVMMPYMLFICLAAQLAATLQCLSNFAVPALTPTLLNICWLIGAWCIAPWFAPDRQHQAFVLAACVVVAGVLQAAVQVPSLYRRGFRFDFNWPAARPHAVAIVHSMGPMVLGLAVTQLNTLMDSVIALAFSSAPDGPETIAWLNHAVAYPMQQGAAASVYYGERIYEFPLGILGIAVATAIFPLLSRHAARGDRAQIGRDLTLGLRIVLFLGIPASFGLMLVAEPLARLLFERGQFTAHDTARAARMIALYSSGIWAYCALPVVIRGYYALGNRMTPVRVGMAAVGLNLALNLSLIWPMAEAGLAIATTASAVFQLVGLASLFSRKVAPLAWRPLAGTAFRAALATMAMTTAIVSLDRFIAPQAGLTGRLVSVAMPVVVGASVYGLVQWLLGGHDLRMLVGRHESAAPDD
jgi:putative peptidoglycan lipid II flippase